MDFHSEYVYSKKGINRRYSRELIKDVSSVHKEKRKLTLLRLGIDCFTLTYRCEGRVWGEGDKIMVLHEAMTTTMLNY